MAVSSGTAALHLSLLALGIRPGDHVVVPAFTFVATANAVSYCGAIPNFVDCDDYGGLDPEKLDAWLSWNKVKAVVCVHCFGHLCDVAGLKRVCDRHGVPLIEDAAQALGTDTAGMHGVLAAFSFNGNKIVTTGGGGAVVTRDKSLADKVRHLANVSKADIPHVFWHSDVGFNYRMPNMNAALGCAQLERLPEILRRKYALRNAYHNAGLELLPLPRPANCWLNSAIVADDIRREVVQELDGHGIECRLSWTPLHYFTMYRNNPRDALMNTLKLASSIVNVPSGPGIMG